MSSGELRSMAVALMREILPPDKIVYRGIDGEQLSASDMIRELERGTARGREYVADIYRVARDLLAKEARNK